MRCPKTILAIMRVAPLCLLLCFLARASVAGSWTEDQRRDARPGATYVSDDYEGPAIYSFPVNTYPDGWAALKAGPSLSAPRLDKIYDGTLFRVIGEVPGWKLVRFKSGETGWIIARLVGCCRPASH